jgi:hypothetical protein
MASSSGREETVSAVECMVTDISKRSSAYGAAHIVRKCGTVSAVWQETVFKVYKEPDLKIKFYWLWNGVVSNFGMNFVEENVILLPC